MEFQMVDKWTGNSEEMLSLQQSIDKAFEGRTVVHTALNTPVEINGANLNFRWCVVKDVDGYLVIDGRDVHRTVDE